MDRIKSLSDLKSRRLRGDLIQMYKIVNNLEKVTFKNGLNFSSSAVPSIRIFNLKRHSKMLHRERVRNCLPRFNFLVNRVVNSWNSLPTDVVDAISFNSFKSKLDGLFSKST